MPETLSTRRLRWLLRILLVWVGAIFLRLIWLQVIHHSSLLEQAQRQQQKLREIPALRGTIFDRTGQPLAKTLPAESICVNPQRIPDPAVAADLLSGLLDLDRSKLYGRLVSAKERGSGFLWIKRKIDETEAAKIRKLNLSWVEFRQEMRRFYPQGELASQVVGSISSGGDDAERGSAGIELEFDEDLSGRPGLARVFTDVKQNAYDSMVTRAPEPGANLTLTIDPNLQYVAEQELDRAAAASRADSGSVVVLNPYTGEVLAMANYPRFNPNLPLGRNNPASARNNLAITTPFEPGSVFKTITLSAALETTNLRPDTMIDCGNGSINLFGRIIHDHSRYSSLSMADVLAKSSNIGAINIGLKVGDRKLYDYIRKFGFGDKTGIDLPGESAGMLRRVEDWTPSSIGSVAMGQEIGATSIQLALAGAVIANGGLLVKPQIVLARHKPGQAEQRYAPDKATRIIAPETAIQMRRMMEGVVLTGTGRGYANLKGYTSGGKTGSAQIFDLKAHVYTHTYNASFLGFAPVTDPKIVIAVTLEGTKIGSRGFGGPVAGPVFRKVATSALRMEDVPKDIPEDSELARHRPKPDLSKENDLSIAGLDGPPDFLQHPDGPRSVSSVTPPPVQMEASASAASVPSPNGSAPQDLSSPPDAGSSPGAALGRRPFLAALSKGGGVGTVPDFRGMTLRAVLEESSAEGLAVEPEGSGLALAQDPPPGAVLAPYTRVRVQFGR
ncbi:MAG TPA: penicillin-binding protein [Bryobacteraceae bacterium]|nr:penicillin-binding protein [Bryobacteraceae bacterium]